MVDSRSRGVEEQEPSHFFKIILSSTLEDKKLRIPKMFVKKFGDELPDVAALVVPNGCVWQVGLKKNGGKIWFQDGWHEFVKYHSICVGYLLVFKYAKNSTFDVIIFDMTACEIDYPYGSGEPKKEEQNSTRGDEMEDESIEILGSTIPDKNKMYNSQESLHRKSHPNKTDENLSAPSPDQDMGFKIGRTKFQTARRSWEDEQQRDVVGKDGHEELVLLEEMGIYISGSYCRVASQDRHRAITAARLFKPKSPSFMVIMQANYRSQGYLYVPLKFAKRYLRTAVKFIKLQDSDENEWPIQTRFTDKGALYLRYGWTEFLNERNLVEGDICVFELINVEDFRLKVSVFNAI